MMVMIAMMMMSSAARRMTEFRSAGAMRCKADGASIMAGIVPKPKLAIIRPALTVLPEASPSDKAE